MPLLILLFIVVPLVELFVIIEVGQAIGVWPTIALLFLDSILPEDFNAGASTRART